MIIILWCVLAIPLRCHETGAWTFLNQLQPPRRCKLPSPSMIQMTEVLPPSTCSCLLWWPGRQHQSAVFSKRKAPKEKMKAHATGNKKLLLSLEASIDLLSKKDASLSPRPHNLDHPPDVELSAASTPKLLMTIQLGYSLADIENPKHCLIIPIMEK